MTWATTPQARAILAAIPDGEIVRIKRWYPSEGDVLVYITTDDRERALTNLAEAHAASVLGYTWQECFRDAYDKARCSAFVAAMRPGISDVLAAEVARRCGDVRRAA